MGVVEHLRCIIEAWDNGWETIDDSGSFIMAIEDARAFLGDPTIRAVDIDNASSLRAALVALADAGGGHYNHFDRTMQGGAGCPACRRWNTAFSEHADTIHAARGH